MNFECFSEQGIRENNEDYLLPHVLEQQQRVFVMFTVNMDEDREKWEKDVKEYNLPWPVVSDLKAYSGPVAQNYHVKGIPMIYLIDPEGKIMARDLRREPMIEYINKLFK